MALADELRRLEEQLTELLLEVQAMRRNAERLEKQSGELVKKASEEMIADAGYDALAKLYADGYHICVNYFAKRRLEDEDCIFCRMFLQERLEKAQHAS